MTRQHPPADRRPIASREHRLWQRLAEALAARGVSPNLISILGMFPGIAAGACFAATPMVGTGAARALLVAAALLIQLRLLANMLDGMVAMAGGRVSPVGELFNEVPDRISDMAVLIGAGYAAGSSVELGFIAALLAVLTAYLRAAVRVAGAPSDFGGPLAKPQRMFVMTVAALAAAVAPAGWLAQYHLMAVALAVVALGSAVTCVGRLRRAGRILASRQP